MGQEQHTPASREKGSHFTKEQRIVLEWMWNGKGGKAKERSPTKLAALLGKSRRTIYGELERGMTTQRRSYDWADIPFYSGELAQIKADGEKRNHGPAEKIGHDHALADAIAVKITGEQYSPYAVQAGFDADDWPTATRLCAKTIYRYIAKGMLFAVTEANLPRGGRRRKKSGKPPVHSRMGALKRSIDRRPEAAGNRSEAGHWEMDTVKGPQNGRTECLLTLTERKTRAQIIRRLQDGTTASVVAALDAVERELADAFPLLFKSVTADNGVEFSDYEGLERSALKTGKRFSLFFAHPYRASERGTNEHSNGMIRRFFPKGTDFSLVSDDQAARVQNWMNSYPRKILAGLPPRRLLPLRLLA